MSVISVVSIETDRSILFPNGERSKPRGRCADQGKVNIELKMKAQRKLRNTQDLSKRKMAKLHL